MDLAESLRNRIEEALRAEQFLGKPFELYDPIAYTLSQGGKRIRPLLALISCAMFDGEVEDAIEPAKGIEFFHNFTLLHDDIMDQAALRRGNPTVWKKWNTDRAILSGDTMFVLAYEKISKVRPDILPEILELFNITARQVCEGQQLDMNFETNPEVSTDEYLEMIRLKTAVLIACSLKLGALVARTSVENADMIYRFGIQLGMAFQIRDDFLDVFGRHDKVGKEIGGDIVTRKKTYLYLTAFNRAKGDDLIRLTYYFHEPGIPLEEKIHQVRNLYLKTGVDKLTQETIESYSQEALHLLKQIPVDEDKKIPLRNLVNEMLDRDY